MEQVCEVALFFLSYFIFCFVEYIIFVGVILIEIKMELKRIKKLLPTGFVLMICLTGCTDHPESEYPGWDSVYLTREVLYPKGSKPKRILQLLNDRTESQVFTEYVYDSAGRTETAIHVGEYVDSYTYDENDRLTSISSYSRSSDALTQLTTYSYDADGNLTGKQAEYLNREYGYTLYWSYAYADGRLVESQQFRDDLPRGIRRYEYDSSGQMVRELFSIPEEEEAPLITNYLYRDGLLVWIYKENSPYFSEQRIYDLNGNLIEQILDISALSSLAPTKPLYEIRRYEY